MLVYKYIPAYGIYLVFSYWLLLLEVVRETNTVKTKTSFFEDWEVWGSLQDNYLIVVGCYELRRRRAKILKKLSV